LHLKGRILVRRARCCFNFSLSFPSSCGAAKPARAPHYRPSISTTRSTRPLHTMYVSRPSCLSGRTLEDKTPLTNQLVSRPILQLHQHPLRAGTDGGSALFRARAPAKESHCRPDRRCGRNLSSGVSCVVPLRTGAAEPKD
jgi:hypothetical protein